MRKVIIPAANMKDLMLQAKYKGRVEIVPAENLGDVLDVALVGATKSSLVERRDNGCGVLMISDDLDEVMLMSDRIAVMYEGKVMGVFRRSEFDRERIGLLMGGQEEGVLR